jgi:uncharacterized membrane protein YtjA (UPF0391 family)
MKLHASRRGRRPEAGRNPVPPRLVQAEPEENAMLKYAILLLVVSLIAGAIGLTNVSRIAKRVSLVLFGLFFLGFLALLGFAYLLGEAFEAGRAAAPLAAVVATA